MKDKFVVLMVIAVILGIMETACILAGTGDANFLPVVGIIGGLAGYIFKEPVDKGGEKMKAMLGF
jgi:hypothetical protein